MALGKIPAPSISPASSISSAAGSNAGLRNINPAVKDQISSLTNFLSANVGPDKPISKELLSEAIGKSGNTSIGGALANLAPTESTQKASAAAADNTKVDTAMRDKFAFNLPGQSNQEKTQSQDFLKNPSGGDWMSSGASLT